MQSGLIVKPEITNLCCQYQGQNFWGAELERNQTEEAKSFIQQTETKKISDPPFHQNLAMICEDAEKFWRAGSEKCV